MCVWLARVCLFANEDPISAPDNFDDYHQEGSFGLLDEPVMENEWNTFMG